MYEPVTEDDVRVIRIIYLALAAGTIVFAAVVAFLSVRSMQSQVSANSAMIQVVHLLLLVLIVFALVIYAVAGFLFRKILQGQDPQLTPSAKIRSAYVVRVAMYEGVAFFGLTVCLIASLHGVLNSHPRYVVAAAPYFIFLGLVYKTFPSKESMSSHVGS